MNIRKITTDDIAALQALSRQTFWDTFTDSNPEANMQQYLQQKLSM